MTEELNISTTEVSGESSPRRCADPHCPFQKPERVSASDFAEMAQLLGDLAKRGGLEPPAFQSPTRLPNADRTIRRRKSGAAVIAINLDRRSIDDVQNDMIDGVITATGLSNERVARFRNAAERALLLRHDESDNVVIDLADKHDDKQKVDSPQAAPERGEGEETKQPRKRTRKRPQPIELETIDDATSLVAVGSAA